MKRLSTRSVFSCASIIKPNNWISPNASYKSVNKSNVFGKSRSYCNSNQGLKQPQMAFSYVEEIQYAEKVEKRFRMAILFGGIGAFGFLVSDKILEPKIKELMEIYYSGAIMLDISKFNDIQEKYKTKKLCILAIKLGANLNEIPFEYRYDEDLLIEFVEKDPDNLVKIDYYYLTQEICDAAFLVDKQSISKMPKNYVSHEMSKEALLENPNNYALIPDDHKSLKRSIEAVNYNIELFEKVPVISRTADMCKKALNIDAKRYAKLVPLELAYEAMLNKIVEVDPSSIGKIPKNKITTNIALTACRGNMRYWDKVPFEIKVHLKKMKYNEHKFDTTNLAYFAGELFTGKEFCEFFPPRQYIKFYNSELIHQGLKYKQGTVEDPKQFDKHSLYGAGLYFTIVGWHTEWQTDKANFSVVEIEKRDDVFVKIVNGNTIKTNRLKIGKIRPISDFKVKTLSMVIEQD